MIHTSAELNKYVGEAYDRGYAMGLRNGYREGYFAAVLGKTCGENLAELSETETVETGNLPSDTSEKEAA